MASPSMGKKFFQFIFLNEHREQKVLKRISINNASPSDEDESSSPSDEDESSKEGKEGTLLELGSAVA